MVGNTKQLIGAIAAMVAVVIITVAPGAMDFTVDLPVHLSAIASVTGLGGFQVLRAGEPNV